MKLGNGLEDVKVGIEAIYLEGSNALLVLTHIAHEAEGANALVDLKLLKMAKKGGQNSRREFYEEGLQIATVKGVRQERVL